MDRAYLDHNAGSPLRPEAKRAILAAIESGCGNPSSIHRAGHRAKILLEEARAGVAGLLGAPPEEVVLTGGGTEANNLALFGVAAARGAGHLIVSRIEHSSVLEPASELERRGFAVSRVAPDPEGRVDPAAILDAVRPDTILVSLIHASNELGTLQEVGRVAEALRGRGVTLHTDAAQSAGRIPLEVRELGADLVTVSSPKLGGPPGAGCLWIRPGTGMAPLLRGGGQESNRRAGSEPLPALAGFGAAARAARAGRAAESARMAALRDRLEAALADRFPALRFHARGAPRLPNTISVAVSGCRGEELVAALDLEGVEVSTGSACSVGTVRPSHVLEAIGCGREESRSTLRISLGWSSDESDVEAFVAAFARVLGRIRARGGERVG